MTKSSKENIESLRESIVRMEAKKAQHLKDGRIDIAITIDQIISVVQDDIAEQEKDLATNRDGATD